MGSTVARRTDANARRAGEQPHRSRAHRLFRTLLGSLPLLVLFLAPGKSAAAATVAGTVISNTVTAAYTGGQASSNTVSFRVAQVAGLTLAPASAAATVTAGQSWYYPFTLTNTGNGPDTFSLSAGSALGWTGTLYRDDNADGLYQATEVTLAPGTISLPAGGRYALFLCVATPLGVAGSDTETLTARSGFDSTLTRTAACTTTAQAPTPPPPAPLQASFSASPTSGSAPLTVVFTDTSGGTPTEWQWSFGDGATATDSHPTHTYLKRGRYTVTLTVRDGAGKQSKLTRRNYIVVSRSLAAKSPLGGPTIGGTMQVSRPLGEPRLTRGSED